MRKCTSSCLPSYATLGARTIRRLILGRMPLKSRVDEIQLEHHLDAALGLVGGDVDDLLLELTSYAGRKSPSTHGDAVLVAAKLLDRAGRGNVSLVGDCGETVPEDHLQEEKQRVATKHHKAVQSNRPRVPSAPTARKVTTKSSVTVSRSRSKHQRPRPRPATTTGGRLSDVTVNEVLYKSFADAPARKVRFPRREKCAVVLRRALGVSTYAQ